MPVSRALSVVLKMTLISLCYWLLGSTIHTMWKVKLFALFLVLHSTMLVMRVRFHDML